MPRWGPDYIPVGYQFTTLLETHLCKSGLLKPQIFYALQEGHKTDPAKTRRWIERQIADGTIEYSSANSSALQLTSHHAIRLVLTHDYVSTWWKNRWTLYPLWPTMRRNAWESTADPLRKALRDTIHTLDESMLVQAIVLATQLHRWTEFSWASHPPGGTPEPERLLSPLHLETLVRAQLNHPKENLRLLLVTLLSAGFGPEEDPLSLARAILA